MLAAMPLLTNNGITMASATGNDNNYKDDSYGDYPKDDSYGDYPKDDSYGDYPKDDSYGDYPKDDSYGDYPKDDSYGDYPKDDSYGDYSKDHSYGDYSKDTSYSTYPPHDMKGDKGQKGDKGDRGDKGKNGGSINQASIYTNVGANQTGDIGPGGFRLVNSTALCDAGDTAISGSFRVGGFC